MSSPGLRSPGLRSPGLRSQNKIPKSNRTNTIMSINSDNANFDDDMKSPDLRGSPFAKPVQLQHINEDIEKNF